MQKVLPFSKDQMERLIEEFPTPFHLYDERGIRETARRLYEAFDWVPGGFKNFFAVKALPNPYILKILKEEGMGADCSSLPELVLAEKVGLSGEEIMFTSNNTPYWEYQKAWDLGARINLDDITHISYLEAHVGIPEFICMRYNPGPLKKGNAIIGHPEESKYGFTREQIIEGYRLLKEKGAKRFGLHTMVVSNELNVDYFEDTARLLFSLVAEVKEEVGVDIEFINMGGGIGIPYRPDQEAVDLYELSRRIKAAYDEMIVRRGLYPARIVMENGRMVTGPHGFLITRAIHRKHTYKRFIGVDACMANLMRPGMYGAYHHITVLGKEDVPPSDVYDVVGSLCENIDKFAIDRALPPIEPGDIIVIHDTGAHGHAMGFNYNGKLRSAEILLREDGSAVCIRRAETVDDYFATLDFSGLDDF
ncbi:Orn/DAP/Arg decarboxylase 2 [Spirochaeta thermophila DSM 6578]|uniref:Diaminopimelate decarboxylase n=1 Tax=Winmispira thermophila (strain ATCC 700085 / DSM 6578 / Z-1203) TaxID=869211 RepID=G0GBE5_WINT7|nr:diaminopimelate decarboxylase [Spirochaeta thermophila]AEJ60304.1 Orn/DAP/Arg decarboxylase 2 [Spirochaeta thermophila DSM 6578]